MNNITNQDFETALKDVDNVRIVKSVTIKFSKRLGASVSKQCGYIALWNSLKDFDPSKDCKFSTYLYRVTFWTCLNEIRFNNKEKYRTNMDVEFIQNSHTSRKFKNSDISTEEICSSISEAESNLIKSRYIHRNTLKEITNNTGMPEKKIRAGLKGIISKINMILT